MLYHKLHYRVTAGGAEFLLGAVSSPPPGPPFEPPLSRTPAYSCVVGTNFPGVLAPGKMLYKG